MSTTAVGLSSTAALGQTAAPTASIADVRYTGTGDVDVSSTGLFLWQSAAHEFTVSVSSRSDREVEACLLASETSRELACERSSVRANETEPVTVGFDQLPANVTGEQDLRVVLRAPNATEQFDQQSVAVVVLREGGDLDSDGLTNKREVSIGTDLRTPDTDDDGLSDREEVEDFVSSPVSADSDSDGLPDDRELQVGSSPIKADSDGDGISDAHEVNTYDTDPTTADTDGDGLDDGVELNTYKTNPKASDTEGDGLSDALEVNTYDTDPGDPDTDGDGLSDGAEVYEFTTDPANADTDGDGLDDGAEVNRYATNPLIADTDGDGLSDGSEVNRHGTDPTAADTDGDGRNDGQEVQIGDQPGIAALGLVAAGILLAVAVATIVVYRTDTGQVASVPLASLRDRVRSVGNTLAARRWSYQSGADSESTNAQNPEENQPADDREGEDPASASSDADQHTSVPPEFLSNESRVLQVLDANDGRIQQSAIVEETGWSKSKVSRVLSKMEDDGLIAKIDVGRGNVITRPDDVPPGANSPFER